MKPVPKPRIRGRFWYPVLDTRLFSVGDVIFIDHLPSYGHHEIRLIGQGELLVRRMSWIEVWLRRKRGRLRRWWLRHFGTVKGGR